MKRFVCLKEGVRIAWHTIISSTVMNRNNKNHFSSFRFPNCFARTEKYCHRLFVITANTHTNVDGIERAISEYSAVAIRLARVHSVMEEMMFGISFLSVRGKVG